MTVETTVNGGYRITDIIDGRYISRLYVNKTRATAVRHFKRNT